MRGATRRRARGGRHRPPRPGGRRPRAARPAQLQPDRLRPPAPDVPLARHRPDLAPGPDRPRHRPDLGPRPGGGQPFRRDGRPGRARRSRRRAAGADPARADRLVGQPRDRGLPGRAVVAGVRARRRRCHPLRRTAPGRARRQRGRDRPGSAHLGRRLRAHVRDERPRTVRPHRPSPAAPPGHGPAWRAEPDRGRRERWDVRPAPAPRGPPVERRRVPRPGRLRPGEARPGRPRPRAGAPVAWSGGRRERDAPGLGGHAGPRSVAARRSASSSGRMRGRPRRASTPSSGWQPRRRPAASPGGSSSTGAPGRSTGSPGPGSPRPSAAPCGISSWR